MFLVDYVNDIFTVNINDSSVFKDRDELESVNNFLDSLYIFYAPSLKARKIEEERIEEILTQFTKHAYTYDLTKSAAEALLSLKDKLYSKETVFFRSRKFDQSILNEGITPYNFQIDDINWRLKRSAYLDANDAGLGKTFENICVASQNYKEDLIDSVFIVCPGYLSYHWKYEILKFVNIFKEDDIIRITNDNKIQPYTKYQDKKIVIISNNARVFAESILSYKDTFKRGGSLKNVKWKLFKFNLKEAWNKKSIQLIADESHCFKHSSSVRTKTLLYLKSFFSFRSLLSATPNINHFEDIYPQMKVVDKSIIPFSENSFKMFITEEEGKYGRYSIKKYNAENVAKIKSAWVNNFAQRLKKDVPEMKAKQDIKEIYLELSPELKKIYQLIVEQELSVLLEEYDELTWKLLMSKAHLINEVFNNAELLRERQYSSNELEKALNKWSFDKDPKFLALTEMLEDYIDERNEKVIIYDYRPKTLDTLYEKLKKYNPEIIHGSLEGIKDKDLDRKQKEDKFNNDPNCKIFLLSSLTSSAGLNLQKSCHRVIVYNMNDDGESFRQLMDRTHRINSTEDTIVEILYYPETFENVRVQRNLNRISLNDRLGKEITEEELKNLLNGKF